MMVRLFAAATVAVLALVGGCSTSSGTGDGAGTPAARSTNAADDTEQACADVKELNDELLQKFLALVQRKATELSATDDVKRRTNDEILTLAREYADKIDALGATVTNPELKQVLATEAADLKTATSLTIRDVIDAARDEYNPICGR